MARSATIERNTKETWIQVALDLDGGPVSVETGIGFFDHMLTAFGFYAKIGLTIQASGTWRWTATIRWRTPASAWGWP